MSRLSSTATQTPGVSSEPQKNQVSLWMQQSLQKDIDFIILSKIFNLILNECIRQKIYDI